MTPEEIIGLYNQGRELLSDRQYAALAQYHATYAKLLPSIAFGDALCATALQNRLALRNAQPGTYTFGQQLGQQRIKAKPLDQWETYG